MVNVSSNNKISWSYKILFATNPFTKELSILLHSRLRINFDIKEFKWWSHAYPRESVLKRGSAGDDIVVVTLDDVWMRGAERESWWWYCCMETVCTVVDGCWLVLCECKGCKVAGWMWWPENKVGDFWWMAAVKVVSGGGGAWWWMRVRKGRVGAWW